MCVDSLVKQMQFSEFGCCDSNTLVNIHITLVWTYMAVNYGT